MDGITRARSQVRLRHSPDRAWGRLVRPLVSTLRPAATQHLGIFFLLTRGNAEDALGETLRYTHQDRFPKLPGYHTFTSHWHMAIAMAALQEKAQGHRPVDA